MDENLGRAAEIFDAQLVLADGFRDRAHRRRQVAPRRQHARQHAHDGQRIGCELLDLALQREAEQRQMMDVEAVGAAERARLDQYAVEDHRQREAEHGEEDAAIAPHQEAGDEGDRPGDGRARHREDDDVVDAGEDGEHRRRIAADAVIEALPEGDEAEPHLEHDAERDEAGAHRHLQQEAHPVRRDQRREQDDCETGDQQPVARKSERVHILRPSF
jgi:hypothetical protein